MTTAKRKNYGKMKGSAAVAGEHDKNRNGLPLVSMPASVALLVALQYALPGYGHQRVWVQGPGWPDHYVRL